ncbi:MAG TPA: polysaccharide deacetylase family protein [bacterium]|jgi:polysaccharide deacetylase family sporulation protein PdaB|nr:polysaccharide deacetylase family protein [bacterium]
MRVLFLSRLRLLAAALIFFLAVSIAVSESVSYLAALGSGTRLVPIYSVDTPAKKIAISFDAAWGADKTPLLLEILAEYGVRTTFFLVDFWMEKYPEMTKQIAAAGHELGNHTATHPHLASLTAEQIGQELETTNIRIQELTGQEPLLFRPPFGEYNNMVLTVAKQLGLFAVQWDVDSLDWQELAASEITQRVIKQVRPGSIVLFHNNASNTATALPEIIGWLHENGYEIVPISELIYKDNYYIEGHTGKQCPKPSNISLLSS